MKQIHADELHAGDVIEYAGQRHLITLVDRRPGWLWPIAVDGTGWAIALDHRVIPVFRPALAPLAA